LAIAITFVKETHMQQRQILNRMLGIAVLAMLFGASSVHGQTGSAADASTRGAQGASAQSSGSSGKSSDAGAGKQESGKSLSKADQNLVRELAQSNLAEIEAGKIALSQSKNEQVRNFAQRMIDDHQQAQKDLEQIAQAKGVTLPTEPDNKHKAAAKKLSALEGDKFDKQYMKQGGLTDHRNTHRLLQRAQTRADDADLKALAAKMEPIVSQHLTMAQDVSGAKSTTSGSQGPAGTSSSGAGTSGTSSESPATSGSGKSGMSGSGTSGTSGSSNSTSPGKQ
jgi:putative membrane protein